MNLRLVAFFAVLMGTGMPIFGAKITFYYDYHYNDASNKLLVYAGKAGADQYVKTIKGGESITLDTKDYNKAFFNADGASTPTIDLTQYPDGKKITLQNIEDPEDYQGNVHRWLKVVE